MSGEGKTSIFKIGINLTLACLISGLIIAGVYAATNKIALDNAEKAKIQAITELVPGLAEYKPVDGHDGWFAVYNTKNEVIGYVVPATGKGYGGAIKMLVSATPDGKIINYKILSQNETPGLGDRDTEESFRGQFKGKTVDQLVVVKKPTKDNIEAMTGSTITSRAVTDAVKQSLEELVEYLQQNNLQK